MVKKHKVLLLALVCSMVGWGAEPCGMDARDIYGLDQTWADSHESFSPLRSEKETVVEISRVGVFTLARFDGDHSVFIMDSKRVFRRWSSLSLVNRSISDALKVFFWLYQRGTVRELSDRYGRAGFSPQEIDQALSGLPTHWRSCQVGG